MEKKLKGPDGDADKFIPVTFKEKRRLVLKSILVVLVLDYFFYRSLLAVIPLSALGCFYFQRERKILLHKKKERAREQFKELMLLASTGQKAGYSPENAFISSYQDMKALYGEESTVCRMIQALKSGRENNIAFSRLWKQMGNQLGIAEISEFASVYEISHHCSGNMASVMEKTASVILHKIETEKEISLLLSARELEQKIMNIMPFFIMLYINLTSPGYFGGLYHCPSGVLLMTICLFLYLSAYLWSARIVFIKV